MSYTLSPEETFRALRDQGVPEEKAKLAAGITIGGSNLSTMPAINYVQVVGPSLRFPIRFVLPWSALISDNKKYGPVLRGSYTVPRAALTLLGDYRVAKTKARDCARRGMTVEGTTFPALAMPLSLTARVYVPDNRVHDVCNFAKCAHDAMESVVFKTDSWLYDVRWIRAGIDVDHPRAEIEIQPL